MIANRKKLPHLNAQQAARFWRRVIKGDCWVWIGPPKVTIDHIKYKPARIAYALACGVPTDTGCVVRLCDTPNCVNPAHLKDVTPYEAGIRRQMGNILKIRAARCSAPLIALNEKKPLELIDAIKRGKIL